MQPSGYQFATYNFVLIATSAFLKIFQIKHVEHKEKSLPPPLPSPSFYHLIFSVPQLIFLCFLLSYFLLALGSLFPDGLLWAYFPCHALCILNFRSRCGVQASETHHLPARYSGEYWVKARDEAGKGLEARAELTHAAKLCNRSQRAKKKSQI